MMTVVLRNVRPRDYNSLPVSEIVALRHDTKEARGDLQDKLQALVFGRSGDLQEIEDADELERSLSNLFRLGQAGPAAGGPALRVLSGVAEAG